MAATGGGGSLRPPLGNQGGGHFGPHIAKDHLLLLTYRGHMPKFRLKSQKMTEILRFENFKITRFFPFVDAEKMPLLAQFLRYSTHILDLVLFL